MKNLWPERFEENPKRPPKNFFEEQAEILTKITNAVASAEVVEDRLEAVFHEADFCYRFDITGKYLPNYRFKVLSFSHDITLYPVAFKLDSALAEELRVGDSLTIGSPEELQIFLERVLTSDRIKNIVGSILKLSK